MIPLRTLKLRLDDEAELPLVVRRETTGRSAHTGRPLAELHAWATTADPEVHREWSHTLRSLGDRAVHAMDETGEPAGRWDVFWNSYGESAGVHTYTLILREAEELTLEALLLDELELRPYEYREEVVGDEGLAIQAKVVSSEEQVELLRAMLRSRASLRVVRRGIQEEPREMRLGVAEWSQTEDRIRLRLVLVDRELGGGGRARAALARIDEENSRAALGYYANFMDRLADAMVARGVLSAEELHALREDARSAPGVARRELWRVVDVDEV